MRRKEQLIYVAIATFVIVVIAMVVVNLYAPTRKHAKTLLIPELKSRIGDVAKLVIHTRDEEIVLVREGEQWLVKNHAAYPADVGWVRIFLLQLANLDKAEKKTNQVSNHNLLDLGDNTKNTKRIEIYLYQDEKPLANIIVGRHRFSRAGEYAETYIRYNEQDQVWLVKGALDRVSPKFTDWIDRNILDIQNDRIKEIAIHHPDGETVQAKREKPGAETLQLVNILKGKNTASELVVTRLSTMLENISINAVHAAGSFNWDEQYSRVVLSTFDGLHVNAKVLLRDGMGYVHFSAKADQVEATDADPTKSVDDTKLVPENNAVALPNDGQKKDPEDDALTVVQEATYINEQLSPWVFVLPQHKFELFITRVSDLVK